MGLINNNQDMAPFVDNLCTSIISRAAELQVNIASCILYFITELFDLGLEIQCVEGLEKLLAGLNLTIPDEFKIWKKQSEIRYHFIFLFIVALDEYVNYQGG